MVAVRALVLVAGAALVSTTVLSAVRTLVLPRAAPTIIGRLVFVMLRRAFTMVANERRTYEERDHVMALYGPVSLLVLPGVWVALVIAGFTAVFWGTGLDPVSEAFVVSGSSLLTLGFARPDGTGRVALAFLEAALGLGAIGLVISYLPTIYSAFSRRETLVALLETVAGSPPSPQEMFLRHQRIGAIGRLDELWPRWQVWFADVEESHTSIAALCFFRSPQPDRSWITAAGCVLDAAAITASSLDRPREPNAELCLRSGYVALRGVADFFSIAYDPDPAPGDPISIRREEFDEVLDSLAEGGVALRADRDRAWRDFNGWRVNYDAVLVALAGLVMAPYAPWSSDRSLRYQRPPLTRWSAARRRRAGPSDQPRVSCQDRSASQG